MTAVYIILGIAAVLCLLSLLRVGVRVIFGDELHVTAVAGPLRVQLLPKRDKPEKETPKKPAPEKRADGEKKKREKKLDLTAEDVRTVLPAVWQSLQRGLQKTRRRLRIEPLKLSAVLGGALDPAGAAELYGYVNAAMWTVMPQLEKWTYMPDPQLHTEIDFDAEKTRVSGEVGLSFQIRDLFAIGWAFAAPLVRWYMARQKRKRAAEKQVRCASVRDDEHTTT